MLRYTQSEAMNYWRDHAFHQTSPSVTADPDDLDNVCHTSLPLAVNRYYAGCQERAYQGLLARTPIPHPSARALDVGCGAGRWCRLLMSRGYYVTGIDLQKTLIERNRARYPLAEFENAPLQTYETNPGSFSLISSVTVLQHNTFSSQQDMVARIRLALQAGGHAIILENVREHDVHMFPRSKNGWCTLFETNGFRLLHSLPYDFSIALRSYNMSLKVARRIHHALAKRRDALQIQAARVDAALDIVLSKARVSGLSTHRAFLFQAI